MLTYTAQLLIQLEGNVVDTIPLLTPVLTIGRLPDNDLPLPLPIVSGHHAELRLEEGGAMLTDLGSRNGTYVGAERLLPHQPYPLAHGATFLIHPYVLTFQELSRVQDREPSTLSLEPGRDRTLISPPREPDVAAMPPEAAGDGALPPAVAPDGAATPLAGEANGAVTPPERYPARLDQALLLPAQVVPAPLSALAPSRPPRPTFPMPVASGPRSDYLRDLPVIFEDGDFLGRLLLVPETIWEPLEQRQNHIDMYFSPRTCPVSFLPWLARWLHLPINRHWPESRIRDLLAEAMDLYTWRGTAYGLTSMIEICTGLTPQITEDPSEPMVFRISVTIPAGSEVDRDVLEHLILTHKPAHAAYILDVGP